MNVSRLATTLFGAVALPAILGSAKSSFAADPRAEGAAKARGGIGGPQPTGDFTHTPAAAQKANTPLPIYVEPPAAIGDIARVVVKYKSASMSDWYRLELDRVGRGWGGQIRCADVTVGTMRYWIQGFDAGGDAVASSGDPRSPYAVPIKDAISTEPPHLPGKGPPRTCREAGDCPPGLPGCAKEKEESEREVEAEGESTRSVQGSGGRYARLWIGASLAVDFVFVPSGDDLCKLSPTAEPLNSANFYCTNPDGSDFPTQATKTQNDNLVTGQQQAGHSNGGIGLGNARAILAADYAISASVLAGVRVGYVFNAYTGSAAVNDGRALGPHLHLEARGTYLFGGQPLAHEGLAPMAFVGAGVSEFDHQSTSFVRLKNAAGSQPVNIWLTDAPFFVALGGGLRYQFSLRAAFTAAARVNAVIGGNGFLPTFGPDVAFLYGF